MWPLPRPGVSSGWLKPRLVRFSASRRRKAQEGIVARSQQGGSRTHSLRRAQLGQRLSTWRSRPPCRRSNSKQGRLQRKQGAWWRGNKNAARDAEPGKLARMEGDQDQICRGHYTVLSAECSASRADKSPYQSDAESATLAVLLPCYVGNALSPNGSWPRAG